MSTRCSILLKKQSESKQALFYRHCDGYAIHEELETFIEGVHLDYGTTKDFEKTYYAMSESYSLDVEKLDRSDVPSDVQYLAVVDLDAELITTYYVPIEMNASIKNLADYKVDASFDFSPKNLNQVGLVTHLRNVLPMGAVHFTYKKVNGETRTAVGTLKKEMSEKLAEYVSKGTTPKEGVITYWDLNSDGWRALKEENLVSVEKVEFSYKKD